MSMVIANNMSAVNTKRQFASSSRGMSGSMERLSSGYKINTGKDDPSGLLISEQLRSQLNGLKRAQQNTEEAINVMGIAEGALNEMNSILKKMKALAIHSANTGVTSAEQIAADQAEMDSAIQTLDRIAQTTSFSGEKLLNGSKDIAYETLTNVQGTQQNALLNTRDSTFQQIFKRDGYKVNIGFTGTAKADETTGLGKVDFSQQAMKAYLEVDTSRSDDNRAQVENGKFTQDQAFTLTGAGGSRAFSFKKGDSVANMVQQIQSAADTTGIDAALVFNSDQRVHMAAYGISDAKTATGPIDEQIEIAGLFDANGNAIGITMEMGEEDADELRTAMKEAGIDSLSFRVDINTDNTFDLIAIDNTGAEYKLTTNWNGRSTSLPGALGTVTTTDGDAAVADALAKATFLTNGDIDAAKSADPDDLSFTVGGLGVGKIVLSDIYSSNDALAVGDTIEGEMTIDFTSINWNSVYKAINPDDRSDFLDDLKNGKISIEASLSGKQSNYDVTLTIVGTGGTEYHSETFKSSDLGINNQGVTVATGFNYTNPSSAFSGMNVLVEDDSLLTHGYRPGQTVNDSFTKVGITGTFDFVPKNAIKGSAGGYTFAAAGPISMTFGMGIDNDTAASAISFKLVDADVVNNATQTLRDALTAAGLNGTNISFDIEMKQKSSLFAATTEIDVILKLMDHDSGKEYEFLLAQDWDGEVGTGASPFVPSASSVSLSQVNGNDVPAGVINALNAFLNDTEVTLAIDGSAVASAQLDTLATFDTADFETKTTFGISNNILTVPNGIYNTSKATTNNGEGQVQIDISDIDLVAVYDTLPAADKAKFLTAIQAGTLEIKFEIDAGGNHDTWTGTFTLSDSNAAGFTAITASLTQAMFTSTNGVTDGFVTISGAAAGEEWLNGLKIKITDDSDRWGYNAGNNILAGTLDGANDGSLQYNYSLNVASKSATTNKYNMVYATGAGGSLVTNSQVGGAAANGSAARATGNVVVFNNTMATDEKTGVMTGGVAQGIAGVTISQEGGATVQFGLNTDGQGRIWVKFIDDSTYELYKDESMSRESLVATGVNGQEINEANNSGLKGFTLDLAGDQLSKKTGVYLALGGIEGQSHSLDENGQAIKGTNGVTYSGSVVGDSDNTSAVFNQDLTYITGVELGKNTSDEGKLHLKTVYDHETGTAQVFAYRHQDMKAEDLVASSEIFNTRVKNPNYDESDPTSEEWLVAESMTVILNEVRNSDNTAGTGLGIALVMDKDSWSQFDKNVTLTSDITFNNLGARVFSSEYGSDAFIKITADKGSIFNYYGAAGQNSSKTMIDAGASGKTVQITGQDATLSVNGQQVTTKGLILKMATQDIQASLIFNQGKVGTTTLAQVGYEVGSIFTKVGALNLDSVDEEEDGKYEYLSGLMCNAGHVTNESVTDFQGGMQLQLGEGSGDQNRTVVSIKSMTSDNLGKISRGGYWDGTSVWTEKNFSMQDVMGGGVASLSSRPTLAMAIIDKAIEDVSGLRAQIGAVQTNLLQTNSNNLSVTMENIQKTESGIRDADMADEMTEFTKFQVLQNAAMSMMAQANQSSQNVLQLLR